MAKSYYIPGVGHFTDGEGGKSYYIPGSGHFTEATVVAGETVSPVTGTLTYTGSTPTITALFEVNPTQGLLSYTGEQPTITTPAAAAITPTQGVLTYSGQSPQITTTIEIGPTIGTLTYVGEQPQIVATVAPQAGLLTYTGQSPTITFYSELTISPTTGILTYSGAEASIGIGGTIPISPTQGTLTYTGGQPTFSRTWIGWTEVDDPAGTWEEIDENLAEYEEDLDQWVTVRGSVEKNAADNHLGKQIAERFIESTDTGTHELRYITNIDTSVNHTFEAYLKANGQTQIQMQIYEDSGLAAAIFDLDNETVSTQTFGPGTVEAAAIKAMGNGWYRCTVTGNQGGGAGTQLIRFLPRPGGIGSYAGDGSSGFYVWNAKLIKHYEKTIDWTEKTDDSTTWSKL